MAKRSDPQQESAVAVVAPSLPAEYQPIGERGDVRAQVEAIRLQVEDILPSRMDADRFLRVAASAVMGNPKLMECTRVSLLLAIHEAAQLGLEPTGLLGSAYLVPFRRKVTVPHPENPRAVVDRYVMEAKLIPGYRGLIDLARRSGEIQAISAHVVRQRDVFRIVQGSSPDIIHEPHIPNPASPVEERDPGPYIGAYMVAVLTGGWKQSEWMTYDEIEKVRRGSRAADDKAWTENWPEMARKTVVRRGSKYLPMTTDFRRALELDEEAEKSATPVSVEVKREPTALDLLRQRALGQGDTEGAEVVEVPTQPVPEAPGASSEGMCAECGESEASPDHDPGNADAHPFVG